MVRVNVVYTYSERCIHCLGACLHTNGLGVTDNVVFYEDTVCLSRGTRYVLVK